MKPVKCLKIRHLESWQAPCSVERRMRCLKAVSIVLLLVVSGPVSAQSTVEPPKGMATFKGGVDLVTVSAVVRDQKGRVVTDLTRADFELLDNGERRPITDFRAERAGVSVALLFDASGSMQVAAKIESARQAARHVLAWLKVGEDELAIFSFDTGLRRLQAFASYREDAALERSMVGIAPFGMTSLNDAIAATAKELAGRPYAHRAVVVLTDGVDNASQLSAPEVSGIASSIDVPVYILAVVSPLDHAGTAMAVNSERPIPVGDLADLARWTGGEFFVTSVPAQTSLAARQIIEELRHQYVLAFEPATRPGWHPLEVRAQHGRGLLVVRARSGYMAGQPRTGTEGIAPEGR
jgi:Ca-activated chloride channel family protein